MPTKPQLWGLHSSATCTWRGSSALCIGPGRFVEVRLAESTPLADEENLVLCRSFGGVL
jgi:hypothetical protein